MRGAAVLTAGCQILSSTSSQTASTSDRRVEMPASGQGVHAKSLANLPETAEAAAPTQPRPDDPDLSCNSTGGLKVPANRADLSGACKPK